MYYTCIPLICGIPVTATLSFLTLNSPLTVSSGDDDYAGPVSTGTGFQFGDGYIHSVYVSIIQKDAYVYCTICSVKLYIHLQAKIISIFLCIILYYKPYMFA